MALSQLTETQRKWLEADEALWRRAREIVKRYPHLDVSDVYHTIKNFRRPPSERLRRGLTYGRAGSQRRRA